jgi:hypothetical protein
MRRWSVIAAVVLALVCAPSALANPGAAVLADCNSHGKLTHQYTTAQLRAALSTMPVTLKEYTDCSDVIQRALLTSVSNHHVSDTGQSGSGGSFLPTWLIVILVLLALGAVTLGAIAIRRRGGGGGSSAPR